MRGPAHQLIVALPTMLVTALGIGLVVQDFGLESTDLLASPPTEARAVREPATVTAPAPGLAELVAPRNRPAAPSEAGIRSGQGITGFAVPSARTPAPGASVPGSPAAGRLAVGPVLAAPAPPVAVRPRQRARVAAFRPGQVRASRPAACPPSALNPRPTAPVSLPAGLPGQVSTSGPGDLGLRPGGGSRPDPSGARSRSGTDPERGGTPPAEPGTAKPGTKPVPGARPAPGTRPAPAVTPARPGPPREPADRSGDPSGSGSNGSAPVDDPSTGSEGAPAEPVAVPVAAPATAPEAQPAADARPAPGPDDMNAMDAADPGAEAEGVPAGCARPRSAPADGANRTVPADPGAARSPREAPARPAG